MGIFSLVKKASEMKASDLHISVGIPPTYRVNGSLVPVGEQDLSSADTEYFVRELLSEEQWQTVQRKGELDLSLSAPNRQRFRLNVFRQRGSYSMAIRLIHSQIPSIEALGLPSIVRNLCRKIRGIILVTGPSGSGKSTTLASMIDLINSERDCHIITLEDPIEYLHKHKRSIVNQREIGSDSMSYANALKAVLRQDPDVILIGEMRDLETIRIALTAAETGHLVLSTLHTIGAVKTIDRIVDAFLPHQQQQIRVQLSMTLEAVISQQLIATIHNKGRVAAVETMVVNPAIRNLIREGKTHQIMNVIQTSANSGMKTMDNALAELYKKGMIRLEDALAHAVDQEYLQSLISYR
ncbi:MAG: type IV pilus twitching motility protein PilT [Clostridia bacterium]|jgi:twitching motility protein PilT